MKKKLLFLIPALILLGILVAYFIFNQKPFYLADRYYGEGAIIKISREELLDLEEQKESFALLIFQPVTCGRITAYDFYNHIEKFLNKKQMSFYQINFIELEGTKAGQSVKYSPSVAIYQEGKIIAYLDAKLAEHTEYYYSAENFETWFQKYVLFKED